MPTSSVQTADCWDACPVVLPNPDVLVSQLYSTLLKPDAKPCNISGQLKDLLEMHPAFAQLLAKSPELRSVIESGAEELLPQALDTSYGLASSRVMWTILTCVWQGISIMVDKFSRKLPSDATNAAEQLRFLIQSNNEMRAQLSKCRRDYLRELTELRERCRRLEPNAEAALNKLLQEEPVMFYEPLDFVLEDTTKQFISRTVEEKLRLLMLRGWKQVDEESTDVSDSSAQYIKELEAEVAALRAKCEVQAVSVPCAEEDGEAKREELCVAKELIDCTKSDEPASCLLSAEIKDRFFDKHVFSTDDLDSLCASDVDEGLTSTRCSTAIMSSSSDLCSSRCSTAMSGAIEVDNLHESSPAGSPSMTKNEACSSSCPKCAALQSRLGELCARLQQSVGSQMMKEVLIEAGLADCIKHEKKRPKKLRQRNAFDRLYADAKRRDAGNLNIGDSTTLAAKAKSEDHPHLEPVCHSPSKGPFQAAACTESSQKGHCSISSPSKSEAQQMQLQEERPNNSAAPVEESLDSNIGSLEMLHPKSLDTATIPPEAKDSTHFDSAMPLDGEAKCHDLTCQTVDAMSYTPKSKAQAGSCAIESHGTNMVEDCEHESSVGSPERRRLFSKASSGSKYLRQNRLPRVQSLHAGTVLEPEMMEEEVGSPLKHPLMAQERQRRSPTPIRDLLCDSIVAPDVRSHTNSPEKRKITSGLQVSSKSAEFSHSLSPEKKKGISDLSSCLHHSSLLRSVSQSCSPEKKTKTAHSCASSPERKKTPHRFKSFGEASGLSDTEMPHSSSPGKKKKTTHSLASPERKRTAPGLKSSGEAWGLSDTERPHSVSPEKKNKRSALRGVALEPLQYERKTVTSLSAQWDRDAEQHEPLESKIANCRQHELKKSDSVPKLPRVGTQPTI